MRVDVSGLQIKQLVDIIILLPHILWIFIMIYFQLVDICQVRRGVSWCPLRQPTGLVDHGQAADHRGCLQLDGAADGLVATSSFVVAMVTVSISD